MLWIDSLQTSKHLLQSCIYVSDEPLNPSGETLSRLCFLMLVIWSYWKESSWGGQGLWQVWTMSHTWIDSNFFTLFLSRVHCWGLTSYMRWRFSMINVQYPSLVFFRCLATDAHVNTHSKCLFPRFIVQLDAVFSL